MAATDNVNTLFFNTYKRLPLRPTRGEGVHIYTEDGREYLDLFAGVAVNALGHSHPRVVAAITDQAQRYIHVSNYFQQEPQEHLAALLLRHSGMARVFLANSGAEVVEGALKIARLWGGPRGRREIVGFGGAFHGRTFGALSVMDRPGYRDGFGPFLDSCRSLPFNDVATLEAGVGPQTAAVILECIQGEGGVRPISDAFAAALKDLRRRHGFLVIADEIQSGGFRTGPFLACEHWDLQPDLVTLAKPIGGGLPLGAILGAASVADVLQPGMHGTTFGGNPVACAAGVAVLEEIEEKGLAAHAVAMGALLKERLEAIAAAFPKQAREVRGRGLMLALELADDAAPVVEALRDRGILVNATERTVLRFVPPLVIGPEHIEQAAAALREVLGAR